MLKFALEGFWLLGALAAVYLLGVFTAQYAKDKLSGVPSELRTALKALETKTTATVLAAKNKAVADAVKTITPVMPIPPANPLAAPALSAAPPV